MLVAASVVAAAALLWAARLAGRRLRAPRLPRAGERTERVTALLPVRDEEINVEACLQALLAQTAPLRVRVLDDSSRDRTAQIAAAIARREERVEVLTVPSPPPGTNGKVHALAWGSRGVAGDWILAIDADARPVPEALARALAAAERHELAAVSLAARQRTRGVGEALITPPVFALLDAFVPDWERAARGLSEPVANGQFILARTAALAAAGGYGAIEREALDDVALAARLAATGARVGFWRARDLLDVRMYRGLRATFRGWRRNLGLIFGARPGRALALALAGCLPAAVGVAALAAGAPAAALVAWLGGAAASIQLRVGTGNAPAWGLLYPLDSLFLLACLATGVVDHRRGHRPAWRGRPLADGAQPPNGAA